MEASKGEGEVLENPSEKKRVLCIDDEPGLLDMERLVLESSGYEVFTATRGAEGLELLARAPVDLVLLDYHMPEMTGEVVAREVRSRYPGVRVLLFAASPEDVPNRVLSLVDDFLCKGEPVTKLRLVIARLLGVPAAAPPVRAALRFQVRLPVSLVMEREGRPLVMSGRSRDLSEDGIGGIVEGELNPEDTVWLRIPLPSGPAIESRARVRHHTGAIYGLEFLGLETESKDDIRRFCSST